MQAGIEGKTGSPDPALQVSLVTISKHLSRILDDLAVVTCEIEDIREHPVFNDNDETSA